MILKKEKLVQALAVLSRGAKVLVPTREGNVKKYVPWQPGVEPDLDMVNTALPPKDALFPQTEKMFRYRRGKEFAVEEVLESQTQIIFGMRPCDVASIAAMDLVFLTKTFVDSFYARKRDNLVMVAVACKEAAPTCFCESMGLSPVEAPLADVLLRPIQGGWNVKAQSDRGEQLLSSLSGILDAGEEQPMPAPELSLKPDMQDVPQLLRDLYEDPMWDELYRPCLTCGTCTYLCPTCYCFEIGARTQGETGVQERFWDSCMFSEYTRMAGGHNPRPGNKERVRNRYMHKLSWFEERYGQTLCVGCGRCIEQCPTGMDITHVIDLAKQKEAQLVCNK